MHTAKSLIDLKSFSRMLVKGKGTDFLPLKRFLSAGNLKLPKATAIFNMSSATHCTSLAKGLCKAFSPDGKHVCYAMKAEKLYPNVLPYRTEQKKFWKQVTAEDFAWQFLCINSMKNSPWDKLRMNESGDFLTQQCVEKADKIARYLLEYGIKTYCYTHRSDLEYTGVKYLVINGSNFQKKGIDNMFLMVEDINDRPEGFAVCPMDCRICDMCSKKGSKVAVPRH